MAEHVFLCHSAGDKEQVRGLYRRLQEDGLQPWLDEEDILPGQDWENEIRRAIRKSRYVLVCLSESSVTKSGFVHKEIKQALDIADEQPEGSTFLIPVRLEPCQVPDRLGTWQWVDLFAPGAYERLLLSLKREQPSGTFEEEPRFSRRQPVPGSRHGSPLPPPRETFRDPVGRITSVIESIFRIVVPLAVVTGLLVAGVEFGPGIVAKFQGPGPIVNEAVGPAPWVIEGQGYRYEIEGVARTSFRPTLRESRTSALVINGHVTRIDSRSFSDMSAVVRNQRGTALDGVHDQGQWEVFPTRGQRLPIELVVYDSDPPASHVTITINDFHVRNGDLTLRNLPIPSS